MVRHLYRRRRSGTSRQRATAELAARDHRQQLLASPGRVVFRGGSFSRARTAKKRRR